METPTRQRIVEAARALFSERSWLGVPMGDIADRVGISKPALYHHFASKTELYAVVMDQVAEDLRTRIVRAVGAATPAERLHQVVKDYLEFGVAEKNLVNALVANPSPRDSELRARVAGSRRELEKHVRPVVEDVIAEHGLAITIDSGLLVELLFAMMDGLLLEYSFWGKRVEPGCVADRMIEAFGLRR